MLLCYEFIDKIPRGKDNDGKNVSSWLFYCQLLYRWFIFDQ